MTTPAARIIAAATQVHRMIAHFMTNYDGTRELDQDEANDIARDYMTEMDRYLTEMENAGSDSGPAYRAAKAAFDAAEQFAQTRRLVFAN